MLECLWLSAPAAAPSWNILTHQISVDLYDQNDDNRATRNLKQISNVEQGTRLCMRILQTWSEGKNEVDSVVPLQLPMVHDR